MRCAVVYIMSIGVVGELFFFSLILYREAVTQYALSLIVDDFPLFLHFSFTHEDDEVSRSVPLMESIILMGQ